MSRLDQFPTAATDIEDADLMPIKRGTGVNSDKKIAGVDIKAMFASAAADASQVEAEAGTEVAIRRWSPERIKQAIDALGGGGGLTGVYITAAHNAVAGEIIYINVTSDYDVTLPATPVDGDLIIFVRYGAGNDDCTILRNGNNVNGAATSLVAPDHSTFAYYIWDEANTTWRTWNSQPPLDFPSGGGLTPVFIDDTDSPYTASAGEIIYCNTFGGAITVNAPAGNDLDNFAVVGDETSGTNNITIDADGSETIDGAGTFVIDQHWGQANCAYEAAATNWRVALTGGAVTTAMMDARVVAVASGVQRQLLLPERDLVRGPTSTPTLNSNVSLATSFWCVRSFTLSASADNHCYWTTVLPPKYNSGTFRFRWIWLPSNTNTGTARFVAYPMSAAVADGSVPSDSFGTPQVVDDVAAGVIDTIQFSPWTAAVTHAGAAPDKLISFILMRQGSAGADTFTGTSELFGIEVEWTSDQPTDA